MKKEENIKAKGFIPGKKKKPDIGINDASEEEETDSMRSDTSWESANLYDLDEEGEQEPDGNLKFRSHFDLINTKMQTLRIRQKV